jgi:PAS domain S-box-containing protein
MQPTEFLATADLLPEPMLLVTAEGVVMAANAAFATAAALSAEALAGRELQHLVADPPARVIEYLRACARSGQMVLGSLTIARAEKRLAYRCDGIACRDGASARTSCVLLRLRPKQEGIGTFVTLTDKINQLNAQRTRSEQVEDALRRQSETLEVTLASIGDAVIVTNARGDVTFMNSVAAELTGWSGAQALGQPLSKVFPIVNERTRRPLDNPVAKVLQTGGIIGLANHTILVRPDGREVPIDDSAAPIRLPSGDLFGVVLIFRDITEQRRAEHTRAWLAAIIESSDDAIVSKTLDGTITSWNAGAARLFGYTPEEMIGKPVTTIIPPELQEEERAILARLSADEPVRHFDTVRLAKDGHRVDISLTVSPIRDADGIVVGASKVARDISDRKRAERALLDANRRKDEFLATLAHELRNPLAPIRNAVELLGRLPIEAAARSASDIIDRQLRQMTHLVDDLLDVSRITAGRVRLQIEPLNLGATVAMAIETCRPALDAAGHELVADLPHDPIFVNGDRVRLPQVFSNILNNAVKYTPPGGRIEVHVSRDGAGAVVRIRDTGIGIPAAMLDYVFELFAQVDRSYDRTGGGLGLGLTLAKRLVEMHGGSIEARSEGAGRGSEFSVRLMTTELQPRPERTDHTPASASRRRVLIADDNQDAAVSLAMLLKMMGHETQVVADGVAALEAAETFRPEVVLLDIGMPRLDGYATVRELRTKPWASQTLFIALTGWGQEADRQRAREAGFHHHLVKPAEPNALSALLATRSPNADLPS